MTIPPSVIGENFESTGAILEVDGVAGPEIVLIAAAWFGADRWYYCFPLLGAITLLSALWLGLSTVTREQSSSAGHSSAEVFSVLKDRKILMLFLGIFFIVGVDVGVNYISSKLMAERFAWTSAQVKTAPQVYFLCRTVGALLGAFLLARMSASLYFRINMAACMASMLVLMFAYDAAVDLAAIGCIGFFASSIFSIIYSDALLERPEKANEISGLMITAVAGGAVVPPVMGAAMGAMGIAGGLAVIFACLVYLTFLSFRVR